MPVNLRTLSDRVRQLPLFSGGSGEPVHDFAIRRSKRSRRLSITVHPSGRVEVLAPLRVSDRRITQFVRENGGWISSTQEAFADRFGIKDTTLPRLVEMQGIDLAVPVRYVRQPSDTVVARGRRNLVLRGAIDDEELCRDALKRWLASTAKRELGMRLKLLSLESGLHYDRVQIRSQRTCWGSHSSTGTISLNMSLLFVTAEQLRYLLIHELCHSRHMNHSKRFWRLVERFEPDYKRLDQEMDEARHALPGWFDIY